MMKTRIKQLANANGISTAYQLQKKTNLSASMCARFFRDDVEMISLHTIETLCDTFDCSPSDLFVRSSDAQNAQNHGENTARAVDSSDDVLINAGLSSSVDDSSETAKTWLSTSEVAARLGKAARTVRDLIKAGKLKATQRKTPQGYSNFVSESDLIEFQTARKG